MSTRPLFLRSLVLYCTVHRTGGGGVDLLPDETGGERRRCPAARVLHDTMRAGSSPSSRCVQGPHPYEPGAGAAGFVGVCKLQLDVAALRGGPTTVVDVTRPPCGLRIPEPLKLAQADGDREPGGSEPGDTSLDRSAQETEGRGKAPMLRDHQGIDGAGPPAPPPKKGAGRPAYGGAPCPQYKKARTDRAGQRPAR